MVQRSTGSGPLRPVRNRLCRDPVQRGHGDRRWRWVGWRDGHHRRARSLRHAERATGPRARGRRRAAARDRDRRPPPDDRSARRRPCLLRRGRPSQRRPAALRPAGDDRRVRLLPLPAASRDPLPAARDAVVRGGRGDLDGRAGGLLRVDDPSPGAQAALDVDRAGDARAADGLEPRRGPGPGRRHAAHGARGAVGDRPGGEPQGVPGAARGLVARPAGGAAAGVVRRLGPCPDRRAVRARAAGLDRLHPDVRAGPGGERREPLALRPLADPLGGGRRRRDRHRVATGAVPLGLGSRGRVVGVCDAAAADLPAVDARRRRPRSIRRLNRRPVRGAVRRAGRRPDVREAPA